MSSTYLGVDVGGGMIHLVLLRLDEAGHSETDHRVIDIDRDDGLQTSARLSSGIDLMIESARQDQRGVGAIAVAYRSDEHKRAITARGDGTRRHIRLVEQAQSAVAWLLHSGEVARYSSVLVADCGDTGMTTFRLHPQTARVTDVARSQVISGRAIDDRLASAVSGHSYRSSSTRASTRSAVRTAKEELSRTPSLSVDSTGYAQRQLLSHHMLDNAVAPMATAAGAEIAASLSADDEAVVLIGGIANVSAVRSAIASATDRTVVVPVHPESVTASGAALLACGDMGSPSGTAFIGGRTRRGAMTLIPLAVVGAVLFGAIITKYAIGSSLVSDRGPSPNTIMTTRAHVSAASVTSHRGNTVTPPESAAPPAVNDGATTSHADTPPAWATIPLGTDELSPSTTTLAPQIASHTTAPTSSGSGSPSPSSPSVMSSSRESTSTSPERISTRSSPPPDASVPPSPDKSKPWMTVLPGVTIPPVPRLSDIIPVPTRR